MASGSNSRVTPVDRENKLFVGMLPHDADDMTLTEVFSRFGEITEVSQYQSRTVGLVSYVGVLVSH